jgi:hypothetical protein
LTTRVDGVPDEPPLGSCLREKIRVSDKPVAVIDMTLAKLQPLYWPSFALPDHLTLDSRRGLLKCGRFAAVPIGLPNSPLTRCP